MMILTNSNLQCNIAYMIQSLLQIVPTKAGHTNNIWKVDHYNVAKYNLFPAKATWGSQVISEQ